MYPTFDGIIDVFSSLNVVSYINRNKAIKWTWMKILLDRLLRIESVKFTKKMAKLKNPVTTATSE